MDSITQSFVRFSSDGGHIGRFHWRNSGSLHIELYYEDGTLCQRTVETIPGEFGFLESGFDLAAWQMAAFDQYLPDLVRSFRSRISVAMLCMSRYIPLRQESPPLPTQEDPELAAFRARLEGRYIDTQ